MIYIILNILNCQYNFTDLYNIGWILIQKPINAYVAGWGASSSQCDSNEHGPTPHRACKFPFIWNGKVWDWKFEYKVTPQSHN